MDQKYEKVITAKTFSPLYDEVEDRIRLTINYQDMSNRVDFVITRSLIISLLPALNGYIDKYYKDDLSDESFEEQVIADLKQITQKKLSKEQIKKNNDLQLTNNLDLDLLKTKDTLLERVDLKYNMGSKNTTLILFSKALMVKAILDPDNFQKIIIAIKNAIPSFKWGLSKSFIFE